jgi:hypothetical protein
MDTSERQRLIEQYEAGSARLQSALARTPPEARAWRPKQGAWSVHEIVVHCADSEANAAARLRYLLCEREPVIIGYDQDEWARTLEYAAQDLDDALATVRLVRKTTAAILRRVHDDGWRKKGTHTEHGEYSVLDWLRIYAAHLESHAQQIERNVEAWKTQARHAGAAR